MVNEKQMEDAAIVIAASVQSRTFTQAEAARVAGVFLMYFKFQDSNFNTSKFLKLYHDKLNLKG